MEKHRPNYDEAFELLKQYNKSESLIHHALAVSGVMRFLAKKHGEEQEKWAIVGLVHDLDYEQYPHEHCIHSKRILEELNWDEEYIRAVLAHGWGTCTEVEPISLLEKYLFAIDELTGLITACALVKPSKNVQEVELSSVKKKWKQKAFAAGANREIIQKGADLLGLALDELIQLTLDGMKSIER